MTFFRGILALCDKLGRQMLSQRLYGLRKVVAAAEAQRRSSPWAVRTKVNDGTKND